MVEKSALMVRLPIDIKAWIAAEAARNSSSQNSEVIRALRHRMDMAAAEAELLTKLEAVETLGPTS